MTTPEPRPSDTARIWATVAVLAIVCVTVVGAYAVVPHSNNPGFVVTQLLSFAAVGVAAIRGQYSADKARESAQAADGKLDRVLNGEMQAKLEKAVHDVLDQRTPIPAVVEEPGEPAEGAHRAEEPR